MPFSALKTRFRVLSLAAIGVITAGGLLAFAGPASAALPTGPLTTGVTGHRPGSTELSFWISDQTTLYVDVATGNARVATSSLALVGVNGNLRIGESYNSLASAAAGSPTTPAANKWNLNIGGAGSLSQGSNGGVVYTDGAGTTWPFAPISGSPGTYSSPAGIKADLAVATGSQWTLTERESQQKTTFNSDGQPVSIADRNGNTTTIGYAATANPNTVVSTAGPLAARTASLAFAASAKTYTISQTSGSSSRSVVYAKDASTNLASVTDAESKTTTFGYSGQLLTTITNPDSAVTTIAYDAGTSRVTSVTQKNTTTGAAITSTTRFDYPSSTQRFVARPNTDQATAVSGVPHITYIIDSGSNLVTGSTDEMNRQKSATFTPNGDVSSQTSGTGATAGTSTAAYGANNGDSQTSLARPGGATSSAAYTNTSAATKYLPSSSTDAAGNNTTYSYNGAGNMQTATNALAAHADLTYNSNGTIATATAPGNGTNRTVYNYDGNFQLSNVVPVTGSSLGTRTFTYDDFGRVSTATDGSTNTRYYSYDQQDRITRIGLTPVGAPGNDPGYSYQYAASGLQTVQNNASTPSQFLTRTYDAMGRLTGVQTVNSKNGLYNNESVTYGYDSSSNLVAVTDGRGTTTDTFDASGAVTQMAYATNSGTKILGFAIDDQGRRTDTWLRTNASHSSWTAHVHQDYDTSNRVIRVVAEVKPGTTATTVTDTSYCYNTASAAPTCGTGTATDRSKLQWQKDNITGQITTYGYDTAGRLLSATQNGGTGANTYTYTYDSRGNRLTAVVSGATPSNQSLSFNAANQITTAGYTYDAAGNLTADPSGTYTYSGWDQMITAKRGLKTYNYAYEGPTQTEVISQEGASVTPFLSYGRTSATGVPVIERVNLGSNQKTGYIENDPITGEPLLVRDLNGLEALYVYSGIGNPVALVVGTGSVAAATAYDPYGVTVSASGSTSSTALANPFTFKGGIQDRATGLIHFGYRWYSPGIGQWTQMDVLDVPLDPNNANRYAYSGDDPINNSDPTGRLISTLVRILEAITDGRSIFDLFNADDPAAGLAAAFDVVCSVVGGIAASPSVAGSLLAISTCFFLSEVIETGIEAAEG